MHGNIATQTSFPKSLYCASDSMAFWKACGFRNVELEVSILHLMMALLTFQTLTGWVIRLRVNITVRKSLSA